MSTSLLYHAFGIRGDDYVRTQLSVTARAGTTISVQADQTETPEFRRSGPLIAEVGSRIDRL
jgi:hypothetical protein